MEELSFHSSYFPYGQVSQPFIFPRVNYCFPSLLPFSYCLVFFEHLKISTSSNSYFQWSVLIVLYTMYKCYVSYILELKKLLLNLKIVKENYTPIFPFPLEYIPLEPSHLNLDLLLYFVSDIQQLFWDFLFIMILGYVFTSFLGFQLYLLRVY